MAAYHNYRGAIAKLRAQHYDRYCSMQTSSCPIPSRVALLNSSYQSNEMSRKLTNDWNLSDASARAENNRTDWYLLLYDMCITPGAMPHTAVEELDAEIRPRVRTWLQHRSMLVNELNRSYLEIRSIYRRRPIPPILLTSAQTECLLAKAILTCSTTTPPDSALVRSHLEHALSALQVGIEATDERELLSMPEVFQLDAFMIFPDLGRRFLALQSAALQSAVHAQSDPGDSHGVAP